MGKFCKNCGKELSESSIFCIACGTKVEEESPVEKTVENNQINEPIQENYTNYSEAPKTNSMAIGGFVCSIVGLFFAGILMGIIGICLGVTAKQHIKVFENEKGKGLAVAAIVIGSIDVGLVVLRIIFTVFAALAF